jgi:hypothetical protein
VKGLFPEKFHDSMPRAWRPLDKFAWVVALIFALNVIGANTALGQAEDKNSTKTPSATSEQSTSNSRQSEVLAFVEADARRIIERLIPADSFQIFVKAKIKKSSLIESAYLPDSLTTALPNLFSSWKTSAQDLQLDIRLPARYGQLTKDGLQEVLADKFGIDKAAITFKPMKIETPQTRSDIELLLQKAEADARNSKNQASQLSREREDAKRDLSLAKAELDRVTRTNSAAAADKEKEKEKLKDKPASKLDESPYAKYIPYVLGGVLGLIVFSMIFLGLSIRSTGKTLGSAVRVIGDSIPVLGDKMIEAASQTSEAEEVEKEKKPDEANSPPSQSASPLAGVPLDSLHARIVAIHNELVATINTTNDFVVVRYLTHLLKDPQLIGKAVVSMEIMGKDLANQLYTRLSSDDQEKILAFLNSGTHSRSKWEVMFEAGEELKTKLLADGMVGLRGKVNETIAGRIIKLNPEDIAAIASKLSTESLPRLFLYLDPVQLGTLLMSARNKDMDQFKQLSDSVIKIANVTTNHELDTNIGSTIDEHFASVKEDHQRPFLAYYKTLLESVDDGVVEVLAEVLSTGGPTIEHFVQENVVTFATFFKLQKQLQESIMDGLANREVTALVSMLPADQGEVVRSFISAERMELVQDEVERFEAKGRRAMDQAHSAARRQVVQKIIQLRGTNSIEDLFAEKAPDDDSMSKSAA